LTSIPERARGRGAPRRRPPPPNPPHPQEAPMPKPLSDGAQRLVFGILIVILVSFGIYWSLGGSGTSDPEQQEQTAEGGGGGASEGEGSDEPAVPLPTVAVEDMELADWLPFTEEEFVAAAAVAQAFATDYGT